MSDSALQLNEIAALTARFTADQTARLMRNAVSNVDVKNVALDRSIVAAIDTSMSIQLDTWPITNQKKSGRCWLFAGLNFLKQHMLSELKVDNFEFSQTYLHFWDKLEKANWFLTSMIELAERPLDDRTVACLIDDPIGDGGQWDMFVSLVQKYGVVPKFAMPETESSSNTAAMNNTLCTLLRRAAGKLRAAVANGEDANALRLGFIADSYRVLAIHLGTPPTEFIWQWRDKDKLFNRMGTMTPAQFAAKYITVDLNDYVCVVNDPRVTSPYGSLLSVDHLGNVVGGRPVRYLNTDADTLKTLVHTALKDSKVVWFGCDVGKQFDRDHGLWDAALLDYQGVYGVPLDMTKAERLQLGVSAMTHAMVITGIDVLPDGTIRRYRVENSWGDDRSDKGYDTMNDSWFAEYVFEVAVPKQDLPPELVAKLDQEPIMLPLWDPMGALA
ncbi:MAG: C1 family peptidase [Propionibacteriaceae bacterium]|jgi:bleomycin hydrolase|nr:C1 family peptidase [Propionibacteriaceae bacterium]